LEVTHKAGLITEVGVSVGENVRGIIPDVSWELMQMFDEHAPARSILLWLCESKYELVGLSGEHSAVTPAAITGP